MCCRTAVTMPLTRTTRRPINTLDQARFVVSDEDCILESDYGAHDVVPHLINGEVEKLAHTPTGTKFMIRGASSFFKKAGFQLTKFWQVVRLM